MTPDPLDSLLADLVVPPTGRTLYGTGTCAACGQPGPVILAPAGDPDPDLCDGCAYDCRRYDEYRWAAERGLADTHYWPIHGEPPPKVRPVRR